MKTHTLDIPAHLQVELVINDLYAVYWYEATETDLVMQAMTELNDKGIKYRLGDAEGGATKLFVPVIHIAHNGDWVALQ